MYKIVIISIVFLSTINEAISAPKHPCPLLKLKNGRARYRQRNRFVRFTCNPGYLIAGERYSTCEDGHWDGVLPKCVRSSCVKVNAPSNALIYPSHRGGVLNFFCKPGYTLRGFNATYCDGKVWDNNLPTCIEANTQPALSCDFENEDLCGWNHDLRHDFDWKRKNNKTQSGYLGTGVSYDHTTGEGGDGYYMHIESLYRNTNDTARLISPIYDKINTDVCFEFYYYMHGSMTGQLRVYLKKESQSWNLNPADAFFWKVGNHGTNWLQSWHFLGTIDEDFQIIIEGVRGTSNSDIAIDDIRLIPNCTADELTTESDIEYTFEDDPMQSCFNRCDVASNTTYQCDCDENCIDNNRCCLDYVSLCVLVGSEDYSSTAAYGTDLQSTVVITVTKPPPTTTKPNTSTRKTTTRPTTTTPNTTARKTTTRPTTTKPNTTVRKTTRPTTTKPNTTVRQTTTQPTTKRPTTRMTPKTTTHITTQKITKYITTAIIRTTPTTTKETNRSQTTNVQPTTKSQIRSTTLSKQQPSQSTQPVAIPSFNIPKVTTNAYEEVQIDEILTVPPKVQDSEDYPIFTPSDDSPNRNIAHVTTNDKTEMGKNSSASTIVVIICSIVFVLVLILLTILLVKRHKLMWCRINKMKNTISDSQSDVRFLTSDEILNFNLAYCDD